MEKIKIPGYASKPLDYARGFFGVIAGEFFISKKCPPDIRERLEEDWSKVKAETEERHRLGIFSSHDYF